MPFGSQKIYSIFLYSGQDVLYTHSLGKWLLVIDKLKRLVSEGAILSEVALSMCAEIPSGPLAFNTSKPLRSCLISCVVRSK